MSLEWRKVDPGVGTEEWRAGYEARRQCGEVGDRKCIETREGPTRMVKQIARQ